jgi:hypothetical protein
LFVCFFVPLTIPLYGHFYSYIINLSQAVDPSQSILAVAWGASVVTLRPVRAAGSGSPAYTLERVSTLALPAGAVATCVAWAPAAQCGGPRTLAVGHTDGKVTVATAQDGALATAATIDAPELADMDPELPQACAGVHFPTSDSLLVAFAQAGGVTALGALAVAGADGSGSDFGSACASGSTTWTDLEELVCSSFEATRPPRHHFSSAMLAGLPAFTVISSDASERCAVVARESLVHFFCAIVLIIIFFFGRPLFQFCSEIVEVEFEFLSVSSKDIFSSADVWGIPH